MHLQSSCLKSGETTHQAEANPGQTVILLAEWHGGFGSMGDISGSMDPLGQRQADRLLSGLLSAWVQVPSSAIPPWSGSVPMGHPPNRAGPPAASLHPCDFPCSSSR